MVRLHQKAYLELPTCSYRRLLRCTGDAGHSASTQLRIELTADGERASYRLPTCRTKPTIIKGMVCVLARETTRASMSEGRLS